MTQAQYLEMVSPFKDKVYRLAKRLLVSKEEAEDATQEILIKLWQKRLEIEKLSNIEAYSMTMTKNFCLDKLKSKHAQNLKIVHNNYQDGNVSVQKKIEFNDSLGWVGKIMERLPDQQKIIIQLRDIENYEYNEISKMLKMNQTAIRVALSRARKTIREKLTKAHNYGISNN